MLPPCKAAAGNPHNLWMLTRTTSHCKQSLSAQLHLLKSHGSFSKEFFVKQPAEKYIQAVGEEGKKER